MRALEILLGRGEKLEVFGGGGDTKGGGDSYLSGQGQSVVFLRIQHDPESRHCGNRLLLLVRIS